jgi:hypothetical protein
MTKEKWGLSSIIILLLAILMLSFCIVFDQTFVEQWFVSDGEMDITNRFYLDVLRGLAFCFSITLFLTWFAKDRLIANFIDLKNHMKFGDEISLSKTFPRVPNKSFLFFGITFLLIWASFLIFSLFIDPKIASSLVWERGLFETLTVIFYVISACFLIKHFFSNKDKKSFHTIYLIAFTLFCLFIAGEEISWGQTYLRFETPELLKQVNVQGETGLHNIQLPGVGAYFINDIARMLALFCGVLLPCILLIKYFRKLFAYLVLIPPSYLAMAYFIVAFAIPGDGYLPEQYDSSGILVVKANLESELREITMSVAFLIWTYSIGFSNFILKK